MSICNRCLARDDAYQARYDALVDRIIMIEKELIECKRETDPDWLPFARGGKGE